MRKYKKMFLCTGYLSKQSYIKEEVTMKRIRLTAKTITAGYYETLFKKLLVEYPKVLENAKGYKSGEIKGFVFHHLNFETDNMLPTLGYKGNRDEQRKYLCKVLEYSKLKTEDTKTAFLKKMYPKCDNDKLKEQGLKLEESKRELDKEMAGVVLIPKSFHGYLHSPKGKKLPRANNPMEVYEQFLIYRESLTVDELLDMIDKSRGSVSKGIVAIKNVTDYLLYNRKKDEALDIMEKVLDVADNTLKDLKN